MTDISATTVTHGEPAGEAGFRDYLALMKPRVMQLVVFTAAGAMLSAPGTVHPVVAISALICIAVGAGASGALNMWYDADIDAEMGRTSARPIPRGNVEPDEALGLGLGLAILSVVLLTVIANPLSGALLAFTIFFYVAIYTMWLKRWTPQNIVIGGAAGAVPPVIAWTAVTGGVDVAPVLMFLVIFLWTPPHFWALALFRKDDYRDVGVPMLPVVAGEAATRRQIWIYALLLAPVCVALAFTAAGGPLTLAAALYVNARFLARARAVLRGGSENYRAEKRLFVASIGYLFALFGAVMADALVRLGTGWTGWPVLL